MGVILDTSIWVDVERGRLTPRDVASLTHNEPVYLVPPIVAELEYGIHRAATDAQRTRRAAALARIRRKPCLIIDRDTAEIFGRISASLDSQGKPATYRTHDIWIAAAAIQHRLSVLTRNRSDFEGIPGMLLLSI
ncbi:MAG TPA: PIN domain-containing protein [Kiritimatiellia bacterium]|nr:PIN domain-containing protein [Kiritimatiellia bacterium]HMP00142.1 PIN domain-containing protein [Kiritimatiellia bacterium]HMP96896.1 PIN domain-containing protein [Kiritimatiellia bacterium]